MQRKINSGLIPLILLVISFVYSCANRGPGPTGGPKDETPPRVTRSLPENGALNFKTKEIMVEFDENISLEKLSENVVISPPQKKNPDIRSYSKRLVIKFEDDLRDSTTYTLNFGNAIVDLNEKNPLPDYRFSFSTGSEIDTLSISGILINAEDLNPVSGIIVGIYDDLSDSVFQKKPFLRIGKTNEQGYFTIDNVKECTYQLYALGDNNRDYYFQPGEGLAFMDSLITPTFTAEVFRDTVWSATDSTQIDSVYVHHYTRFMPDDVVVRYFKESKIRQYYVKNERLQPEKFTLYFNTTLTELPVITPLNFEWDDKYILQRNNTLDTLTYWLTDSLLWQTDTLKFSMDYEKTDSIYQLIPANDTINAIMRKLNTRARNRDKDKEPEAPKPLDFKSNAGANFEIYNPITLKIDEPLISYDIEKIHLYHKVDTILNELEYVWEKADSAGLSFNMRYQWKPGETYQLTVDSAAFTSIYNKSNNKFTGPIKVRKLEEYSKVNVVLVNYDERAVIQLLNAKDEVVSTKPAITKKVVFEYLKPADYYIRMFIDENGNGKWDTGDLATRKQPEEVYYYPYKLSLKANFEFTEEWDSQIIPLLDQKPEEIWIDASKKK